ncbi:MAG: HD domain-containing protein [Chloroflexaceae bacterium]|nr:HD domain-containing protein [Chloroflexaceae bacterium]NJL34154.1 HD domain-containing protein [Chloroflexaceae bacterium]NJO05758.1 HD domain-containing protein [Chloroflexaceae bacterium]
MPAYSARYEAALTFAAQAHRVQVRKGTDIPYITHPVHVATLLLRYGYPDDVLIAGLLHDVLEDAEDDRSTLQAAIATQFGSEVERLVVAVSKPSRAIGWEAGRAAMIEQINTGGPLVAALKAADTVHNIRSIIAAIQHEGATVWGRFKRGPAPTLAYYRQVRTAVGKWINWHPLCHELETALQELEQLQAGQL